MPHAVGVIIDPMPSPHTLMGRLDNLFDELPERTLTAPMIA